ncbi:hypothetical protein Dimus_034009 [Dionaea muscipula]
MDVSVIRDSKLQKWAKHALTRATVLKNQHLSRCSHARSDVDQLLKLGHQEQALLRVEHVIREQNMVDVFAMVEKYCHLLAERATPSNKDRTRELKEAISSLIFVSTRIGEFPELLRIRDILASKFGKKYTTNCTDSHSCDVNLQMIQKFSTRQQSFENRLMVLKEIATENGISLHLGEDLTVIAKLNARANKIKRQAQHNESATSESPQ